MQGHRTPPTIYSLGDSAITLDLGNGIDPQLNSRALAIYRYVREHSFPGILDTIVAYCSVSVLFDPARIGGRSAVSDLLWQAWQRTPGTADPGQGRLVRIPVCYEAEYGPDLEAVARQKQMSPAEFAGLHCSVVYRIYMIGFLPGFPYMGKLDARLDVPRKQRPVPVLAGGVGIAGRQTGIYPLDSPGGWQIIGRTPVTLFDRDADPPVRLSVGDRVEFYPVSAAEFVSGKSE
ncbi:MAG TPA: 5-oxoprolinase subunit PxpB [Puia sp.]|nr:5-oxoprolinase subunit PxpB [Puia sp.]